MVGMVISGQYFGWNYGLEKAGVLGFCIAAAVVTVFYVCFIFCCAELSAAIPHAGGPSAFSQKALGPFFGYITGLACLVEFVFAAPAIAVAAGYYLHFLLPVIHPGIATIVIFTFFIIVNLLGAKNSAIIELIATLIALLGLLIFYFSGALHFSLDNITQQSSPLSAAKITSAIPFAIWLYLAIEGGAMMAEELKTPHKMIPRGFAMSILTLAICSFGTILITAGIDPNVGSVADNPLPAALFSVYGKQSLVAELVAVLGLFGILASLNGIIMGYSRQMFSLARQGFFPKFLAKLSRRGVPYWALIFPGVFGVICAGSAQFSNILITLAAFGAVLMYFLVLISFFVLRIKMPELPRAFKVGSLAVPSVGLLLSVVCLVSIFVYAVLPNYLALFEWRVPLFVVLLVIFGVGVLYYFVKRPLAGQATNQ